MKKYLLRSVVLFIVAATVMVSCSKEDSPNEAINIDGGQVSQAQVATVVLPGSSMTQNVYDATIGEVPIKVVRSGENSVTFYTPTDLAPGNYEVSIPELNATISVEILQTQLTESADATMSDFLTVINEYSQTLGDTPEELSVKNGVTAFNTFYASASTEQKNAFAVLYKANKVQFDGFFQNIGANKGIFGDYFSQKFRKNTHAVLGIALGGALVFAAPVLVTGAVATVAVGVTGVLMAKAGCEEAYSVNKDLVDEVYESISVKIGGWRGSNEKTGQGVSARDNVAQNLTFDFIERRITTADASNTQPLAVQYFKDYNYYNQFAGQTNTVIDNLSHANPAINYEDVSSEQLPTTSPEVNTPATTEMLSNIVFTVGNSDLAVQQVSIAADGQLNLKIKIVGNPSTFPIQTTLKYSYGDGLSKFTGTIPLTVHPSVIGTWRMVSFENGLPMGQYKNYSFAESCPSLATAAYTMESATFTIGESSYSSTSVEKTKQFNLSWSGCTVLSDGPDDIQTFTETENGTYVMDGDAYTATSSTGEVTTVQFQWINKNKVKIEDSVYERQ